MSYKYTDPSNTVVSDGVGWSGLVTVPEVQAWIAEGNTPEPADAPPPPAPIEQIRALEAQYADAQARVTRQALLSLALDRATTYPEAAGLSREEVHAFLTTQDNGYCALFLLEQRVEVLRGQM